MSLNLTARLAPTAGAASRRLLVTCPRPAFYRSVSGGAANRQHPRTGNTRSCPAPPSPTTTSRHHPSPPQQQQHRPIVHDCGSAVREVAVRICDRVETFDALFLRDSCACPRCVDPHSRQKLFQTSDIPHDIAALAQTVQEDDKSWAIDIQWQQDVPGYDANHRTRHSFAWLQQALRVQSHLAANSSSAWHDDRVFWNRDSFTRANKWVDYRHWMDKDEALYDALSHLNKYGLLFLNNVPDSEDSVIDIAARIGTLKDTFYGRTWDVRSKPKAENIAYTPQFLGLHMDLLYTSNPPHLQLLHSLRARTPGGESFFSDAFHAAQELYHASEAHFNTLCRFPVTYHYRHPTQHYHYTRPTLELYPNSLQSHHGNLAIHRVNWSPPFQGPFETFGGDGDGSQNSLSDYAAASHAYEQLLSADDNLFEYRLNEGECVIFDNRRVLHARRAFDATRGERWLKGAYVDDDVFFSKLRVLQEQYEGQWVANGVMRDAGL